MIGTGLTANVGWIENVIRDMCVKDVGLQIMINLQNVRKVGTWLTAYNCWSEIQVQAPAFKGVQIMENY